MTKLLLFSDKNTVAYVPVLLIQKMSNFKNYLITIFSKSQHALKKPVIKHARRTHSSNRIQSPMQEMHANMLQVFHPFCACTPYLDRDPRIGKQNFYLSCKTYTSNRNKHIVSFHPT